MSERKRPDLRRWLPWVAGAAAVLAAIVVGSMIFDRGGASGGTDFPAPLPHERQATVSHDDFVGSDECEECHKHEYDLWKHSTHGNAGGLPGDVRIIAPFDGVPIRFADAVVTPRTDAGQPVFHVREASGIEQVFEVAGVVGGGHMVGGGTQAFFAEFPDGTYRFLPFDYIRQEEVWFCQTAGRADSGWAPITPDLALAACNDWPPNRVLGASEGVANCQQCHGSQITVRYDFEAKNYETRFTTLAINCEQPTHRDRGFRFDRFRHRHRRRGPGHPRQGRIAPGLLPMPRGQGRAAAGLHIGRTAGGLLQRSDASAQLSPVLP